MKNITGTRSNCSLHYTC